MSELTRLKNLLGFISYENDLLSGTVVRIHKALSKNGIIAIPSGYVKIAIEHGH